jgi:predicted transcriptional regulator
MPRRYRRSRIELYADVMRAIANGRETPARIVYAANLSYDRVVKCLNFLEEQSLVEKLPDPKKKRYAVTDRGMEVIRYFGMVETALFYRKKTVSSLKIHYPRT